MKLIYVTYFHNTRNWMTSRSRLISQVKGYGPRKLKRTQTKQIKERVRVQSK